MEDDGILPIASERIFFSTHILTWRMTTGGVDGIKKIVFQLTSSHGGWHYCLDTSGIPDIFQLTSSHGGWRHISDVVDQTQPFQLTSSQGGWLSGFQSRILIQLFNSHPHKEDDLSIFYLFLHNSLFNSHPHKEDDNRVVSLPHGLDTFQLTSSQGGWLNALAPTGFPSLFSTHILTRRMTYVQNFLKMHIIFQLTSSQGGWLGKPDSQHDRWTFQLTSSQGGWRAGRLASNLSNSFSTHILTRRMTLYTYYIISCIYFFNSHPHKEDDHRCVLYRHTWLFFQLTSSQGGWPTLSRLTKPKIFSTHILTRRMTNAMVATGSVLTFQLTSSQGGWHYGKSYKVQ